MHKKLDDWAYKRWRSMIRRASGKTKRPCYEGCSVSDDFSIYANFLEWAKNQTGYGKEGFQLDKDILIKGNKMYSKEACSFVPCQINSLFVSAKSKRGNLPIGVRMVRARYRVEINVMQTKIGLGYYSTSYEAFLAYKKAKEEEIKRLALIWKTDISKELFMTLMKYEVEITD